MTDSQIIFEWLSSFHMQTYYQNFVQAGYDLLTIFNTTPADLAAIGICEPSHRQLLKNNMQRLDISELEQKFMQLLASVDSVEQLLRLIHFEQYQGALRSQRLIRSVSDLSSMLTWEDLEELGVHKLGHQKKFMLVARRLKHLNNAQGTRDG
jgi:hypothetical protein